jgi:hypothetical protein
MTPSYLLVRVIRYGSQLDVQISCPFRPLNLIVFIQAQIQSRYQTHRTTRNAQQKAQMLAPDFPGVNIETILQRLENPSIEPGFVDPRNCLVFWARPTEKIKQLINRVQQELLAVAPSTFYTLSHRLQLIIFVDLWLMPQDNLHLTALEITHSKTAPEIAALVSTIKPSVATITEHTLDHRARLIKPTIGFDSSALALSFVPAAGEPSSADPGRTAEQDIFTYHHLRRDLYELCEKTGIKINSRYVVPSSHLTIARFIDLKDFNNEDGGHDGAKMKEFIQKIEEINGWLEKEFWPEHHDGKVPEGGEWLVGEEKGLHCRSGTLWYGGGETVHLGKGF